ncbi:MAG: hypothetical protein U1E73_13570 [Planctomycetota bacterium]
MKFAVMPTGPEVGDARRPQRLDAGEYWTSWTRMFWSTPLPAG